jgi:beta-lactamase class A
MTSPARAAGPLLEQILALGRQAGATAVAVAFYDYGADLQFSYQGGRVFHAASTIKLAILLALFRAVEDGRCRFTDRLHVRNRFRSEADGAPFFLEAERDGDPALYKAVGRTASLQALAETMIVRSSNLATNLLLDHLGVPDVTATLAAAGLGGPRGMRCLRGVEDEAALAKGLYNQVTADGLLTFFRAVQDAAVLSAESRDRILDILLQQHFNGMIPAGIPESAKARVAHKTGEISTICHDAGMIFLPGRAPYILVILTEYAQAGNASARYKTVAGISAAVHEHLQEAGRSIAVRREAA